MIQPMPHEVVYCDLSRIIPSYRKALLRFVPEPGSGAGISKKKAKRRAEANGALAVLRRTRPDAKVRDHDAHVLVCGGKDCKKRGAKDVRKALKDELRTEGMIGDVRVDSIGCLGLCKHGPNVVVHPGGTWYLGVVEGDVPEIVDRHLKDGEPVQELAAGFRPRKKKR